jgi:hypothetical protein
MVKNNFVKKNPMKYSHRVINYKDWKGNIKDRTSFVSYRVKKTTGPKFTLKEYYNEFEGGRVTKTRVKIYHKTGKKYRETQDLGYLDKPYKYKPKRFK